MAGKEGKCCPVSFSSSKQVECDAVLLSEVSSVRGWHEKKWIRNMQPAFLSWFVMTQVIVVCLIVFCFSSVVRVNRSAESVVLNSLLKQ